MILQTLAALALLVIASPARAQIPTFDVASIKPSAPDTGGHTIYNPTGGRFAVASMTLKDLIAYAWDVRDFQISGGPGWIDSARFDVVAATDASAGPARLRQMLQSLLAERFKLAVHGGTKEMTYYALLVGKDGPKLQPSRAPDLDLRGHNGQLFGKKIPVSLLAGRLAEELERPVLDRTGLTGDFDVTLQWTPDSAPPQTDPSRPSIFTALQEQAGLRLESRKGPVEILLVDHAERPSAN